MGIVGGFDVHRAQITFEHHDTATGKIRRGQITPVTREDLATWLERFRGADDVAFALEATTGWRFVVDELQAAGIRAHLAEPADTRALRDPKRRAKTDRADAHHLRVLLENGHLPESWIPPHHIQELRTRVRLRKALVDERTGWCQRMQATLFHHGRPRVRDLLGKEHRGWVERVELPPAARETVRVGLSVVDAINAELAPLDHQLRSFARRQAGCRALMAHYGIGELTAPAILAELGDVRRFSSSRHAVRHSGLDITVWDSDGKRPPGKLSRQGPEVLRWPVFEAAQSAAPERSPDHRYYLEVKARQGHNRAALSVARRILRWAHHTLTELGYEAMAPVDGAWEARAA